MIRYLKEAARRRSTPSAAIPAGQRVYAIGDIHGRLDLFDDLLAQIDADDAARGPTETHLVLLGDLIDRGPHSAGVVARALELAATRANVHLIMGNHEEMMVKALEEPPGKSGAIRLFYRNGGEQTLRSYGITEEECTSTSFTELRELALRLVPEEHLTFMRAMRDWVVFGDYCFVHAGIRPGVPLAEQQPSELRWIREEFLRSREQHEHCVVHGHSITDGVDVRPNRIGLDTGAYASGDLTAIGLEAGERWFLSTAVPQRAAAHR